MRLPGQKKLQVSLTSSAGEASLSSEIPLTFTVTNLHHKKKKFCRYMTPFEGFYGNILEVKDEAGVAVKYVGIMKKRGEPDKDDYYKLKEGESKEMTFDLLKNYPIAQPGTYYVRFLGRKHMNKLPDSEALKVVVVE